MIVAEIRLVAVGTVERDRVVLEAIDSDVEPPATLRANGLHEIEQDVVAVQAAHRADCIRSPHDGQSWRHVIRDRFCDTGTSDSPALTGRPGFR